MIGVKPLFAGKSLGDGEMATFDVAVVAPDGKSLARQIDRGIRQIDPGVCGAGFCELGAISAKAAADFQNLQSPRRGKIRRARNVPLFFVAVLFDALKELQRTGLSVAEFSAAGV